MTRRSRSGWTLIELLIVIAVIAVLMGILLSVYMRGRGPARETICINNMRQISHALGLYYDTYSAYPLPYNGATGEGGISQLAIDRYITSSDTLRCPLDTTASASPSYYSSYNQYYNYWGYNAQGQSLANSTEAAATYAPLNSDIGKSFWDSTALPAPGKPAPTFPGLANPNAPANTVITHCPFHRQPGAGATAMRQTEIVARVGGSAENLDGSTYDWIRQPR